MSSLKERFRAEQEKRDAEQARRDDERDHLLSLINVLQQGSTTLNEMRNRFLSTYKRDKTASQLNSLAHTRSQAIFSTASGLAHFVDESGEFYQSHSWASSIRSTSGEFAHVTSSPLDSALGKIETSMCLGKKIIIKWVTPFNILRYCSPRANHGISSISKSLALISRSIRPNRSVAGSVGLIRERGVIFITGGGL
jgi:hypothetical protein